MRYQLRGTDGADVGDGEADVTVERGVLRIAPPFGTPLSVPAAAVLDVVEPEPFAVRIDLDDGTSVELSGLGALRTQVLADLADARAAAIDASPVLGGVGTPEVFTGTAGDVPAGLRLYEDVLVVVPERGDLEKIPYPFVRSVSADSGGYRLTVEVTGGPPLVLARLGARTGEFRDLLASRCRDAAAGTSAFLGALLPGLGPVPLRSVAALLRDGVAAARTDLDRIDPEIWPALTAAATVPECAGHLDVLAGLGPLSLGFAQTAPVRRAATGVRPWRDSAEPPHLDGHDGRAGSFGPGLAGMAGAALAGMGNPHGAGHAGPAAAGGGSGGPFEVTGAGFGGPFDVFGPALAMTVLGTGGYGLGAPGLGSPGLGAGRGFGAGAGGGPVGRASSSAGMTPRPDMTRPTSRPAGPDPDALTASGPAPTVVAFVLCATGSHVVYQELNRPTAGYVYRGADAVAVNRALDLIGFAPGEATGAGGPASGFRPAARRLPALRHLAGAFVGEIPFGAPDRRAVLHRLVTS